VLENSIKADELYQRLNSQSEKSGYYLNPDVDFVKRLIESLLINEERYGYQACPCRLASGSEQEDMDIICPCDYRDPDLSEYGACYCALYVSAEIAEGKKQAEPIPDRRPPERPPKEETNIPTRTAVGELAYPVWRCKVCGYLCGRDEPPDICPICKAKKGRFEHFM